MNPFSELEGTGLAPCLNQPSANVIYRQGQIACHRVGMGAASLGLNAIKEGEGRGYE